MSNENYSAFFIDKNKQELSCMTCNDALSLIKTKTTYELCSCKNIRLVYCRERIHISLTQDKTDYWYEYQKT
jgi:hypothetical protein